MRIAASRDAALQRRRDLIGKSRLDAEAARKAAVDRRREDELCEANRSFAVSFLRTAPTRVSEWRARLSARLGAAELALRLLGSGVLNFREAHSGAADLLELCVPPDDLHPQLSDRLTPFFLHGVCDGADSGAVQVGLRAFLDEQRALLARLL